jgi:hypothetical protein
MSKRKWVASKLFAVLGGAGLAIGVCVPRASAQPPFSNANYANRYVCNVTSALNFFTGMMEINPNGAGTYTGGTLEAPLSAFTAFNPGVPPPGNFCMYTLDIAGSSYSVDVHGVGIEVLSWTGAATNSPICPDSPGGTFQMSDAIVLREFDTRSSGAVVRTEITSNNLLDQDSAGYGYCLK